MPLLDTVVQLDGPQNAQPASGGLFRISWAGTPFDIGGDAYPESALPDSSVPGFQIATAGVYAVEAQVEVQDNAGEYPRLELLAPAEVGAVVDGDVLPIGSSGDVWLNVSATVQLSPGDTVEVALRASTVSGLNVCESGQFTISRVA